MISDRHKVRWVKSFFTKIFLASEKISMFTLHTNIFLHSFVIFLTLIILKNTFSLHHKYTLFFFYVLLFFSKLSIGVFILNFEMFFLSLAYMLVAQKFILFLVSGIFAILNRESGFIILLSWLLFNSDYKKLIISYLIAGTFVLLNLDIAKCLINPEFFVPTESQEGQVIFSI